MKEKDYTYWLKQERQGFKTFMRNGILGISIGVGIGGVLSEFFIENYPWTGSAKDFVYLGVAFLVRAFFGLVITAIIMPLYWRYGMNKLNKHRRA